MSEKPLDRLNYFNGQRLEAGDLKLEQQYHIRVRRWLNKSLYTIGIASGLEVAQDPANSMNVIVSPGLALDSQGREIILVEQVSLGVVGKYSAQPGIVDGNYLTIQYSDQVTEDVQDGCTPMAGKKCGCGNGGSALAWGGPALVRAQALLGWTDALPSDTGGKIVLAQVELKKDCTVASVHPEVRRYVGAASEALVHQFALEGARDFDSKNNQRIYFHVRGREPNAVTLYLRGEKFSSLYYTELGHHTHGLTVGGTVGAANPNFTGPESGAGPNDPTPHQHTDFEAAFNAHSADTDKFFLLGPINIGPVSIGGPPNYNNVLPVQNSPGRQDQNGNPDPFTAVIGGATQHIHNHDHVHSLTAAGAADYAGVTDVNADTGRPAVSYLSDLQISIDGSPQTASIQTQLQDANPTEHWTTIGDGTANHDLVVNGTGEIKLDFLPNVHFFGGEHVIEFSVASGGGRLLYNLYVE